MNFFITLLFVLIFSLAPSAYAAKRMPTPEICSNGIDEDHNNLVDDGCPHSDIFSAITGGIAVDIYQARTAGTTTTDTSNEAPNNTFLKNTGNYNDGQWAVDGDYTGTVYPWIKVRIPNTGNPQNQRVWLSTTPFTRTSQNSAMSFVSEAGLPAPPSFGWVKLSGSFTFSGSFILYGLNTSTVEIACLALMTSSSSDPGVVNPQCEGTAPATGITHNATGTAAAGSAVSSLQPTITVAAGSNKILFAGISHRTLTNTISSMSSSVDGPLTLLNWINNNNIVGCAVYYKINPTAGAHTVTVSFSEAQNAVAGLVAYNGAHQSSPTSTVTSGFATNVDPSVSISGAADQLAIQHLCNSVDNAETVTVGTGQTQRYQKEVDIAGGANRIDVWSDKQGDSNVTLSATVSGASKVSVYQAFMLKPPSAAGSPPVVGTPTINLVGTTTATVEASVDDPSASCEVEYEPDGGTSPPYTSTTGSFGSSGGKCGPKQLTGLTASTAYVFRINATNAQGTTNSTEGTFDTTASAAVTALGITQAEIDVWNTRSTNGPYRVNGDVSTNSPGDWARIETNETAFMAGTNQRWSGNTLGRCPTMNDPSFAGPSEALGTNIRDAAFYSLVKNDSTVAAAVASELVTQAGVAGVQWGGSLWTPCTGLSGTHQPVLKIHVWMAKIVFAYDYVRHTMSAGNKATVDAWLTAFATRFFQLNGINYETYILQRFPNRNSDSYASSPMSYTPQYKLYFGGPDWGQWHDAWNNQFFAGHLAHLQIAIITGDTTRKAQIKRFVQEFVKYNVWEGGSSGDSYRWHSDGQSPCKGWWYPAGQLQDALLIADLLARSGDTSLFDLSTTTGLNGTASTTAKSLKYAAQTMLNKVRHTLNVFATTDSNKAKDNRYRIDGDCNDYVSTGESGAINWDGVNDIVTSIGNVYWKDAAIKDGYLRNSAAGYPSYVAGPNGSGSCPSAWQGEGCKLPAILFMYGQMENVVNPYPDVFYWVSPSGNNSNACLKSATPLTTTAKQTIAAGLACLGAGDTLVVGDGTYVEGINDTIPAGASSSLKTTVKAQNNRSATVRPTTGVGPSSLHGVYIAKSNIIMDGMVIDAAAIPAADSLAYRQSGAITGVELKNSEVKNATSNCVTIQNSASGATITGNLVHNCGTTNLHHGIYPNTANNIIDGNEVHTVSGTGIHIFNSAGGANSNIVRNNFVHDTTSRGMLVGSGSDNEIYRNRVVDTGEAGIAIGSGAASATAHKVYNNTIYSSLACLDILSASSSATVRNNLCLSNTTNTVADAGTGTTQSNNTLSTNTGLVVNAAGGDFTPATGSALINAGSTTGLPAGLTYLGAAPDVGCCELQ